ncbi:BUD13 homolog [Punica granatum]|uniref:Uncharacterized protein n=2 Tax=Punica granatum TaxID=22663 RepID=A0A218XTL8_PUNGR|nr:BUD13 homolog [Punica granatum]OWM88303.1 hypothetical protein CDL15_Pgr003715 [Punica granatum]PKI46915.1 hypothetical protein CRG98_032726 [Punica granatum]
MAASTSGSKSLKEYLKRYESSGVEEEKKKKKKKTKKKGGAETAGAGAILVVDEDPIWQKPINLEEENDEDSADEAKPQIDEDIEVKRMKRLEQLRSRRPYHSIAEDGSGWVSLSTDHPDTIDQNPDISPPQRRRARNDTPSPEPELRSAQRRQDTPSPEPRQSHGLNSESAPDGDVSPPRRRRTRNDTPSPKPNRMRSDLGKEEDDLSPPRQRRKTETTLSPDASPPRRPHSRIAAVRESGPAGDMSPPRRHRVRNDKPSPEPSRIHADFGREHDDLSPVRQQKKNGHPLSPDISPPRRPQSRRLESSDLSPPRRGRRSFDNIDLSPPRRGRREDRADIPLASSVSDLSPPRKNRKDSDLIDSKEWRRGGLILAEDTSKEIAKTKADEQLRFQALDPSLTGKGAEPVYRDKLTGRRLSKEELLKSKEEEKPKEKKLEWGKGLAQKREAEERLRELELEKEKPFARTRDDPELDKVLKDRVRWGDPMAHLVKRKASDPVLPDFGDNEKMKESGFIVPQEIPSHSWIRRGCASAPNRYGIRPGRHWDGVDRSSGFENAMFKRMNEKRATEREAYLWSVSDM